MPIVSNITCKMRNITKQRKKKILRSNYKPSVHSPQQIVREGWALGCNNQRSPLSVDSEDWRPLLIMGWWDPLQKYNSVEGHPRTYLELPFHDTSIYGIR